jgi:phosphoglycolate phosphatase
MRDTNDGAVLFDLDGVLADSRAAITGCLNDALEAGGFPRRAPDELYRHIGPPLAFALAEITGEPADSAIVAACIATYRERYATASLTDTVVTPGIADVLARLASDGRALAVATSKPRPFAEPLLEALGLRSYFAVVAGPGFDVEAESKTETVGSALDALGVERGAMVGDRSFDMVAARAHGLRAIGVAWGIGSRDELTSAGAEEIVETPADLAHARGAAPVSPPPARP